MTGKVIVMACRGNTVSNDAISLKRLLYLGKANLTPEEIVSVAPRQVLNFYGSLELP